MNRYCVSYLDEIDMNYSNEMLETILYYVSFEFIGYARVCKKWYTFFLKIKQEYIKGSVVKSPFLMHFKKNKRKVFDFACRVGNGYVIERLIARYGQLWLDNSFDYLYHGLLHAARYNQTDMIELFIKYGAKDMNHGLYGAVQGGHFELVNSFINRGADDLRGALIIARMYKNIEMIEFLTVLHKTNPTPKLKKEYLPWEVRQWNS